MQFDQGRPDDFWYPVQNEILMLFFSNNPFHYFKNIEIYIHNQNLWEKKFKEPKHWFSSAKIILGWKFTSILIIQSKIVYKKISPTSSFWSSLKKQKHPTKYSNNIVPANSFQQSSIVIQQSQINSSKVTNSQHHNSQIVSTIRNRSIEQ
jgi:hypothetical protein